MVQLGPIYYGAFYTHSNSYANGWFKVKNRYEDTVAHGRMLPSIKELFQMLGTFGLFVFALTIFRSSDLSQAYQYLRFFQNRFLHILKFCLLNCF